MTFSDTSRSKVSYIKETTYGETPNGAILQVEKLNSPQVQIRI